MKEYITKYVGSTERCDQLIDIARESGIISTSKSPKSSREQDDYGILCIPFLLNMICWLFKRKMKLPKTITGIISAIVERCPGWEQIRKSGEKGFKNVEKTILKLGKFVLDRLLKEDFHQQFANVSTNWETRRYPWGIQRLVSTHLFPA